MERLNGYWDANAKKFYDRAEFVGGTKAQFREAIIEWVHENDPKVWVTLSYQNARGSVHKDFIAITSRLDLFLNRICQKAYGKKVLREGMERPRVYGFLEHPHTNKHYNLLISSDLRFQNALLIYGDKTWRKIAPAHPGFHMKDIGSVRSVSDYVNKEQRSLGDYGTAFFYPK